MHQERHLEGSLVDQYACITVTAALSAGATGIFQMYFCLGLYAVFMLFLHPGYYGTL